MSVYFDNLRNQMSTEFFRRPLLYSMHDGTRLISSKPV
jgi:hypothetical protein